jgi:hypothetical protein
MSTHDLTPEQRAAIIERTTEILDRELPLPKRVEQFTGLFDPRTAEALGLNADEVTPPVEFEAEISGYADLLPKRIDLVLSEIMRHQVQFGQVSAPGLIMPGQANRVGGVVWRCATCNVDGGPAVYASVEETIPHVQRHIAECIVHALDAFDTTDWPAESSDVAP